MKKLLTMLSILGLVALAGCKRGVEPPARGRQDITDHRRIFFSKTYEQQLRESTAILEEKITSSPSGQLTVIIPIRSAVSRTLYLEYQYEFYDAHDKRVEGPMGWTPITLEAGSPGTIQFTSMSQEARDYRLTLRFAR
ncbi:MAG: DUF1425 domain-containing protein [Burkholderiales bacterium]|nr:DUF1425 domain-containing protein [Phycisphaerae bacterium]